MPNLASSRSLIAAAAVAGPAFGAVLLARANRAEERRARVLALLEPFLAEPMASTRRSAWAFLRAEGQAVRHFSHYYLHDPDYGVDDSGFAALLKVLLFQRTVQDLRRCSELDERLYLQLLEPHRRAWADYTAVMAERSSRHPEARERGDADLFAWREPHPTRPRRSSWELAAPTGR